MGTQISNPQLLSGARGLVSVTKSDGTTVTLAVVTDVSVTVRASVRDTYVMGSLNALGLDPTAIDVDVSVGTVVPVNSPTSLAPPQGTQLGGAATPGGQQGAAIATGDQATAIGLGLEELINSTLTSNAIDITLQDSITGRVVGSVNGCRFSGRTFSESASDVANQRINFTGIYDAGYGGTSNTPGSLKTANPGSTTDPGLGYGL